MAHTTFPAIDERQSVPAWLKAGFWMCLVIAVVAVVRRLFALVHPVASGPPQLQSLDLYFASHAALTRAHVIPALLFVVLAPVVLLRWTKAEWPQPTLYVLGAIVGGTAYAMSVHAVGGWLERSAVLVMNTWFLISLGVALRHRLRSDPMQERRWLVRAVVVLLGIATTRPIMGLFFATSQLTHLEPRQFFGIAFWIGFSINAATAEWWLSSRSRTKEGTQI